MNQQKTIHHKKKKKKNGNNKFHKKYLHKSDEKYRNKK